MFRGGYACLLPVEEDRAALCLLLGDRRRWAAWPAVLDELAAPCPHLAARLDGATPLLDQPLSLTGLPFGFVHRPRNTDHDGLFRLGDQAALIPSLSADGVSIAMRSGVRAAQTWLAGITAGDYHRRLRAMLWPRMRFGAMLSRGIDPGPPRQILAPAPDGEPAALSIAARWTRLQA
jgi:flavin-dependent dehydrogenase